MTTRKGQPDDLLCIGDAAAALGVKVRTLRLYANWGRIPCTQVARGRRLFLRADIEHYRVHTARRPSRGSVVLYARVSSRRQEHEGISPARSSDSGSPWLVA